VIVRCFVTLSAGAANPYLQTSTRRQPIFHFLVGWTQRPPLCRHSTPNVTQRRDLAGEHHLPTSSTTSHHTHHSLGEQPYKMAALIIPESGLSLGAFPASSSKVDADVPELLGLTLTDNVIEEMIKCVQSGKPIQLSLGDHPVSFPFTREGPTDAGRGPVMH
jgi:hypothetical protein